LPASFNRRLWRGGTNGIVLSIAAILLMTNFLNLNAIANIASATFLIAYMSVYVAHWRLFRETGGSRVAIVLGIMSMGAVLLVFLWSLVQSQPWSIAMIAAFVVGSALVETFLERHGSAAPPPGPIFVCG
jgi:amino acid transporter